MAGDEEGVFSRQTIMKKFKYVFFIIFIAISLFSFSQRGFLPSKIEISYSQLYAGNALKFIELPDLTTSYNKYGKIVFRRVGIVDILLSRNFKFTDVMFGGGVGFTAFEEKLRINVDYSVSYGIIGWNNFSGLIKPNITFNYPLHKSEDAPVNFFAFVGAGWFYRYSYRLYSYWGSDDFYKNSQGYFVRLGFTVSLDN